MIFSFFLIVLLKHHYFKIFKITNSFTLKLSAAKDINDSTKAYTRYKRVSEVYKHVPKGSYLSFSVPNSYWRIIHKGNFNSIIESWKGKE